jgi:hypothetical protein
MSDSVTAQESEETAYERPTLTKVGNVRDLLAGETGTSPDLDPSAEDLRLT